MGYLDYFKTVIFTTVPRSDYQVAEAIWVGVRSDEVVAEAAVPFWDDAPREMEDERARFYVRAREGRSRQKTRTFKARASKSVLPFDAFR